MTGQDRTPFMELSGIPIQTDVLTTDQQTEARTELGPVRAFACYIRIVARLARRFMRRRCAIHRG
jgi:hypothetical protein